MLSGKLGKLRGAGGWRGLGQMAKARIRRVLARNVRRLREATGLSQGALAAGAGIDEELVSRIENGAANPELDTLGRIADTLRCEPHDLFEEWSPSPMHVSATPPQSN